MAKEKTTLDILFMKTPFSMTSNFAFTFGCRKGVVSADRP